MSRARYVVGWREHVDLPQLGLAELPVKVDSGAATSALHAWDLEVREHDGVEVAHFLLHAAGRGQPALPASAPIARWRTVRSSNGEADRRPSIHTLIRLGEHEWTAEVTLARRDQMGYRMLLGRSALRGRFLVDPSKSYRGGTDRVPPR